MRRALTAVFGTVAGTALLVGAKLGDFSSSSDASAEVSPDIVAADTHAAGPAASPVVSKSAARPSTKASARSSPKPRTSSAPPPASGGLRNGTFAGPGVSERFGSIKVTVVVAGGRITDVSASCSCSGRSASISSSAFAKLEPRVLTAQSADVQSVSGATYTYEAYKESLAAAIDSAKA